MNNQQVKPHQLQYESRRAWSKRWLIKAVTALLNQSPCPGDMCDALYNASAPLNHLLHPRTHCHFVSALARVFKRCSWLSRELLQPAADFCDRPTHSLALSLSLSLFNEHYSINHSRYQAVDTRALGRWKGGAGKFHK